ncbi:MAG: hypothetical protein SGCHY_001680 [Lobulomycetales sp.]
MEEALGNPFQYGNRIDSMRSVQEYLDSLWKFRVSCSYRGILTHAIAGEKTGFNCGLEIQTKGHSSVSGIFSIMLNSRNKVTSRMETLPIILEFSAQVMPDESYMEYAKEMMTGLKGQQIQFDSLKHAQSLSLLKRGRLSKIPPENLEDIRKARGLPDQSSEEKAAESNWIDVHLPVGENDNLHIMRLGDILVAYFNSPKVGVFYLRE